jgi:probable rRNA maturation factor
MLNENKVQFHFLTKPFNLKERGELKSFIAKAIKREGRKVEAINYIFCTDAYLLEINKSYLNHDTYTDIITFELSEKGEPLLADIYISVDRVRENARAFSTSFTRELHRVIFHGALHLLGFKDKSDKQARQMRAKEEEILSDYFDR